MADAYLSFQEYTYDGTTTVFEFNFAGGYISREHVKVVSYLTLDSQGQPFEPVPVSFTWLGTSTISIASGLPIGRKLRIYRDTPVDAPIIDFSDGSVINESTLDINAQQAIFVTQETRDQGAYYLDGPTFDNLLDDAVALLVGVAQANLGFKVKTLADLANATVPAPVISLATECYAVAGKGAAVYKRTSTTGLTEWRKQSKDGSWWELAQEGEVFSTQFGCRADGVTDDTVALQAAIDYVAARKITLRLVAGDYLTSAPLIGCGIGRTNRSDFSIIGTQTSKANRACRIICTNHAAAYSVDNTPETTNFGMIFDYTRTTSPEQSGPQSVTLAGFQISAPQRGAGLLISESNNCTIQLVITGGAEGLGSLARYGIWQRGAITQPVDGCVFGSFQHAPIYYDKSKFLTLNKTYNDACSVTNCKFNGKCFALVIHNGSTSFGTFKFDNNTKGGANCSYGFIGQQGLTVDFGSTNWFEHVRCFVKSYYGDQGSVATIPSLETLGDIDIPDSIVISTIIGGGWGFGFKHGGGQFSNNLTGFDLTGYSSTTMDVGLITMTGGDVDRVQWNIKGGGNGWGGTLFFGPYCTGSVTEAFRHAQINVPNAAWDGTQGNAHPRFEGVFRRDIPIGNHQSRMGSGASSGVCRPVKGSAQMAQQTNVDGGGYRVFKIPLAFVGVVNATLVQAHPRDYETIKQSAKIVVRGNAGMPELAGSWITENTAVRGTLGNLISPRTGIYVGLVPNLALDATQAISGINATNNLVSAPSHGVPSGRQIMLYTAAAPAGVLYGTQRFNDNLFYLIDNDTGTRVNVNTLGIDATSTFKKVISWGALYVGFDGRAEDASSGMETYVEWEGGVIQANTKFGNLAGEVEKMTSVTAAAEIAAAGGTALTKIPVLESSVTYNPPSLTALGTAGSTVITTVPVAGVAMGDAVTFVSFSQDLQGVQTFGWVSAPGVISVQFQNLTAAAVDLASGTLLVKAKNRLSN